MQWTNQELFIHVCVRLALCRKKQIGDKNRYDSVKLPFAWFLVMIGDQHYLPCYSWCFVDLFPCPSFLSAFSFSEPNSLSHIAVPSPSPSTSAFLSPGAISFLGLDSSVHHFLVSSPLFFLCSLSPVSQPYLSLPSCSCGFFMLSHQL